MRRKAGLCCMILGVLMLLSAAGFVVYNHVEAENAGDASEKALTEVLQAIEEHAETPEAPELTPLAMPVQEIDGYAYIGYLSIPALDLTLPVMDDWDYAKMKLSPCRYYGSLETDDLVIAGHNYDRHFGRLSQLQIGDTVEFTNMEGTVYTYAVGDLETLPPTATEEMIDSMWELSLYTCTPGGGDRATVRCERINP